MNLKKGDRIKINEKLLTLIHSYQPQPGVTTFFFNLYTFIYTEKQHTNTDHVLNDQITTTAT